MLHIAQQPGQHAKSARGIGKAFAAGHASQAHLCARREPCGANL
jgi:hypothetical protein